MNFQTRFNLMNDKDCEICKRAIIPQANFMVASLKSIREDDGKPICYAEIYMHFTCYAQVTQNPQRYENLKKRMSELTK